MSEQITPNPSVPTQIVADGLKFPKFVNSLGIIPTSYKDSMSYYECLAWLCKYLEETVIPTVNQNGEAVEELQGLYIQLNEYVTNYFDNLDVQEEINNKLDEMTETGVFQQLLSDYFSDLEELYDNRFNNLNQELNEYKEELNEDIYVQDQKIVTLENRMDTFSELPSGSTSGDAELADIRIAYDGITYANAGTSVRTQAENNHDNIENYKKTLLSYDEQFIIKNNIIVGAYYNNQGNLVSSTDTKYKAYPKIVLKAGTYLIRHVNQNFSYSIYNDTVSAISFTFIRDDTYKFTLANNSIVCLTVQYATQDMTDVFVLGTSFVNLPQTNATYLYNAEIKNDINAKIKISDTDFIDYFYQYIDNDDLIANSYYNQNAGIASTQETYFAYPKFILKAGTYYYKNISQGFTRFIDKTGTITTPLNSGSGNFTLTDNTIICVTSQKNDGSVMISNHSEFPDDNTYGNYKNTFNGLTLPFMNKIIVVDSNGNGDYDNMQDCLDNIVDSENNRYTILVLPGTYPKFSTSVGGHSGTSNIRYIDIIGLAKESCIFKDTTGNYIYPAAELRVNGTIKNISFISTNDNYTGSTGQAYAYAVHSDYGTCKMYFENCLFSSTNGPAVGIGLYQDEHISFNNCEFICNKTGSNGTDSLGALYCHTNSSDNITNQKITIDKSKLLNITGQYGLCLHRLSLSGSSTCEITYNIINGVNGPSVELHNGWNKSYSYGNNVNI